MMGTQAIFWAYGRIGKETTERGRVVHDHEGSSGSLPSLPMLAAAAAVAQESFCVRPEMQVEGTEQQAAGRGPALASDN
jgi:hypothetical protein